MHLSSFDAATDNQILKSGLRGGVQTAAPRATLQAVNTVKSTAHGVSATEPDQKPKKVRAKRRPKSGYGRACSVQVRRLRRAPTSEPDGDQHTCVTLCRSPFSR